LEAVDETPLPPSRGEKREVLSKLYAGGVQAVNVLKKVEDAPRSSHVDLKIAPVVGQCSIVDSKGKPLFELMTLYSC
jgi:hypothetical protein